jgi:hypothetical protein
MIVASVGMIMLVIPMVMRMSGVFRRKAVVMIVVVHRTHFTESGSAMHAGSRAY